MIVPHESASVAKSADERDNNEELVVNGCYIALIDAYRARDARLWDGMQAGVFARHVVADALGKLLFGLERDEVFSLLLEALRQRTARCLDGLADEAVYAYPHTRVLIYSVEKQEIWRLGDTPFSLDGELHRTQSDELRAALAMRAEVLGRFVDAERADVDELLENDVGHNAALSHIAAEERRVEGVFSLSGRPDVDADALLAHVEVYPVHRGQHIVFASDGYPQLCETLAQSEDVLADIRACDPLCIRETRQLSGIRSCDEGYDDRSYVRFTVA